jgi:hypothetical protein
MNAAGTFSSLHLSHRRYQEWYLVKMKINVYQTHLLKLATASTL